MIRGIFAVILICFIAAPAFAQQGREHYPIGEIVKVEGKVSYVSPDNKKKSANPGDPVFLNSVLQTEAGSKVLVLFIDDTQITLAENSELIIDEYIFDPYDASENVGEFSILKGGFQWFSGMMTKGERPSVKITTAVGTIGIRGTEFWSGPIDDGYGVFVMDGLVSFAGDWGSAEIPAGKGIFLGPKKEEIPEVKAWAPDKEQRALHKTTFLEPGALEEALKQKRTENIAKRHDFRGRMFPHKQMPQDGYTKDPDKFFTDEFEKMRKEQ
jgi:hypothetical protein